jgi:hypothetical protein
VVATLSGQPLDTAAPIDDIGPTIAVLEPQQEMRGSIDLTERFPSLRQWQRKSDLLVFWSYRFDGTMPRGEAKRVGGWLLVPRLR